MSNKDVHESETEALSYQQMSILNQISSPSVSLQRLV